MPNPIRVHHLESDQYFIVDGEDVYGDSNQDGRISKDDKLSDNSLGVKLNSIRDAGKYIQDTFAVPYPGSRNQDGSIVSAGPLNDVEAKNFKEDVAGVPLKRKDIWSHLDFFDGQHDGKITFGEDYRGWRSLGFPMLRSVFGALASAVIFGRIKDGFAIDVERIQAKRPKGTSGIYDKETGDIDRARLDEFLVEFDKRGADGVLTQSKFKQLLRDMGELSFVPMNQYKTLMSLCENLNGEKTVTKKQFAGLFDSSLLYMAAAKNQRA